jgi:FemAB-related protein (PEP-CTERM system-associated)
MRGEPERQIVKAESKDEAALWQQFMESHSDCTNYHRWHWKEVIERSFAWPTFYLMARDGGHVGGILPLVWQRSRIFGSFLTSLPFLNGGGIVAESAEAQKSLLDEATSLAQRLGVRYLELRHRRDLGLGLHQKTSKVVPVRPVEPDSEKMWKGLHHKLRTDIRKGMKAGLVAEFGKEEFLPEFYEIFAENMRNLGTPVYSRRFFAEMLRAFPDHAHICLVRHNGTAVAGSFMTGYRDTLEAGWSSSRYKFLQLKPNVFLYWSILCFAGVQGYHWFDFGRSTEGSGTHRFKQQWGTQDIRLHWDYWIREGMQLPGLNPENPRYRMAIWLWTKLPVAVTKLVGPRIVRCLP